VRLVWVGASLKERRKGSESKEEGNLCWLLGFNIMGIGFFFWIVRKEIGVGEIEDDECMEDGMGRYHVCFFFLEREGLFLVIFC